MRAILFLFSLICVVGATLLGVQLLTMEASSASGPAELIGWLTVIFLMFGAWLCDVVRVASYGGYVPRSLGDDFYGGDI